MDLLERDPFLDDLASQLREAIAGRGALVLLGGEAGVGKTALVQAFSRRVPQGTRVASGACDPLTTPRPLGPLVDAAGALGDSFQGMLQRGANRDEIFRALFGELTGPAPTLAVFEDVHWADEATLDLLLFLGRRIRATRAMVVATYRDDEVGPRHPLRVVLGDLATTPAVRRLTLPPLSEGAVARLAAGSGLDPGRLHRLTGGNPFFVTEVIAAGGAGIPPTVRDAVLARASRLSPAARIALEAAAVIGVRIEPWLLAEAARPEDEAVEECLSLGVLQREADIMKFRHELARQAVLEALSPLRSVRLHRAVLTALRVSPHETTDPARLAHHAEATGDRDAVLTYAVRAARQARTLRAHREAAAQFGRALRFADGMGPMERARLLEEYAEESEQTGNQAESIAARERAVLLWREAGDWLKEGENLAWLTRVTGNSGLSAQAEEAIRRAIALLDTRPPGRELALAYWMQAWLRMMNCDYNQAMALGEKAIELSERVENAETLVGSLYVVGSVLMVSDPEKGRSYLERALDLALQAGLDALAARVYSNLCWRHGEIFMFGLAERYFAEGISFAVQRDQGLQRSLMMAWLAVSRLYQGRWNEAAEAALSVVSLPQTSTIARVTALAALGRLRARRGDPEVWVVLDEALQLAESAASLQYLAPVHAVRAEAAWLGGDSTLSVAEARAPYDLALRSGHPWFVGELAYWQWKGGGLDAPPAGTAKPFALQMTRAVREAAAAWQTLGCPYEAARALADSEDESMLREALGTFEALGARPMTAIVTRQLRKLGARSIPRGPRPSTRAHPAGLTSRELEILAFMATGLRNSDMARHLHLSPRTVDHHVSSVLAKLGVRSRTEAVAEASRRGLLAQSPHVPPQN